MLMTAQGLELGVVRRAREAQADVLRVALREVMALGWGLFSFPFYASVAVERDLGPASPGRDRRLGFGCLASLRLSIRRTIILRSSRSAVLRHPLPQNLRLEMRWRLLAATSSSRHTRGFARLTETTKLA